VLGTKCRIMLPYTIKCPFQPCGTTFANPNHKTLGAHIRREHKAATPTLEQHMTEGVYFWWAIGAESGESKVCVPSPTHLS
jgi:hypothetical protein